MRKQFLTAIAVLFVMTAGVTQVMALNNGLARTPPMGFNTWNWFGCRNSSGHGYVTEDMIKEIADAFISKGMADVGYEYVNIDDCWAMLNRDGRGALVPDPQFFPNGMKALTDYIHSKGLKVGIYSDVGASTCATCYGNPPQGLPGMQGGFVQQDCDSFVAWGFDYLKLDFCCFDWKRSPQAAYAEVRDALSAAVTRMKPTVPDAHPIVFSICEWGDNSPWLWGDTTGNLWRTTNDIGWRWNSMMGIIDKNADLYPYARIGAWNDPDMLEVGNGDFATNLARNRAHMSLWCIMASALLAGNDIRTMSSGLQEILTNKEVIDVNQDTLGGDTTKGIIQGRRVVTGNSEVWVKLLKGQTASEYAVCFFNRSNGGPVTISVTTEQIASVGGDIKTGNKYTVRDLWKHEDLDDWTAGGTLTAQQVGVNDVVMLRLNIPPVKVLSQYTSVSVRPMDVLSEGERIVIRSKTTGPMGIRIVNLNGEVAYSNQLVAPLDYSFSTKGMARGMYVVDVKNGMEQFRQKIFLK